MTDRVSAFIVILDKDMRDDDAGETLVTLRNIKHVLSVEAHVADVNAAVAESRVRNEIGLKIFNLIHGK